MLTQTAQNLDNQTTSFCRAEPQHIKNRLSFMCINYTDTI